MSSPRFTINDSGIYGRCIHMDGKPMTMEMVCSELNAMDEQLVNLDDAAMALRREQKLLDIIATICEDAIDDAAFGSTFSQRAINEGKILRLIREGY